MKNGVQVATCQAPTNIATIKYWGKRDVEHNTPINDSLSVTLDMNELRTTTSVATAPWITSTRLWLNGEEVAIPKRMRALLFELAKRSPKLSHAHLHIVSENSFPTAAGLASSASGYACLVAALSKLLDVPSNPVSEAHKLQLLSIAARRGSGSASRSLHGGFVKWQSGVEEGGEDSVAVQVADQKHWPELRAIVCVVHEGAKDTGSTVGMQTSTATSELLRHRAKNIVPEKTKQMEDAIKNKNFEKFGRITMEESNQLHACCLDTYPPIRYMNDTSFRIVTLVHKYNEKKGFLAAAYTFDAGPNAVLFVEQDRLDEFFGFLKRTFPSTTMQKWFAGAKEEWMPEPIVGGVKQMIVTGVGAGATPLKDDASLIDLETCQPKRLKKDQKRKEAMISAAVGSVTLLSVGAIAAAVATKMVNKN